MDKLPDTVIVLLVILAAAFSVMMGFGVQKIMHNSSSDEAAFNERKPEQLAYMREVRERNIMEAAGGRPHPYRGH
jgi:hypothetical protein